MRTQSVAVTQAQVDPSDPMDGSVVATPDRFALPAPPPVERFDFNGFVVANTDASVMTALVAVALDGGLDAVRAQLRRVRDSVEAFADAYEGRGDATHDRRAEAGRDLIAKLGNAAAALERVEVKAVSAVVSRGSAVVRAAVARSRAKLDDAKERYGLTATRSRPPKSDVVVTTYAMADGAEARDLAKTAGRLAALRDEVLTARRLAGRAKAHATYSGDRFERYDDVGVTVAQADSKQLAAEAAYTSALAEAMKAHPVLAMFQAVDDAAALDALAAGPSAEAARVLGDEIARIESNLATVESELAADPALVLSMPRIVETAGVPSDPLLARMVADATVEVARDKMLTDVAMAAISVALGIAAAIPTGGTGFVLAAGAAAVVDVVDVVRELDLYATQAAFAGTDFDAQQAFADAPSAFGASMAAFGAVGSAAGVALGLSALAKAMRTNRALGFVAKKLIRETSAREVEAMYAALGAEALESWGLELSGRRIAAVVEAHGDRVGAFARALSPRRAASLLEQLGPEALRAFDGMDPRLLDLAVRDLGITNVEALAPLGGEAVARVHQATGSALADVRLAVVGDRVEIEGLVQVTDFARRAAADPRAMAKLAEVSKSIQANGGLAAASIPELLDFADACRCAGVKLPDGLTPVARDKLAAELKRATKIKGVVGDAAARQAVTSGQRLGAFDGKRKPLPPDAVVVDSQFLIAKREMDEGGYDNLQPAQKAAVQKLATFDSDRVRVADVTYIEARRRVDYPGFKMTVSRSSAAYKNTMNELACAAELRHRCGPNPQGSERNSANVRQWLCRGGGRSAPPRASGGSNARQTVGSKERTMAHDRDSLQARFRCALCGQEHDDDLELDVRDVESGRQFRVGETVRPNVEHLSASYFVLRRPRDGEGLRLVNQVGCENNPSDYAWAEIVFAGDRVVDVQGAVLDRITLGRVHAIHENVTDLFEEQLGVRIDQMMEDLRAAYILAHPPAEHPETSE